jgi:hypothetical protein
VDGWLGLGWGEAGPGGPAHTFGRRLVPAAEEDPEFRATLAESLAVYQRYQMAVHGDTMDKCSESQFKRFLCKSPLVAAGGLGSFHQHYLLDGRIVAVGVVDILPRCVSSVYLYYDPAFSFLSLGTLTSLLELGLVRSLAASSLPAVTSYYLGFYIHTCVKMRYKGRYTPSALACPETYAWRPLPASLLLLDRSPYARLDPDPSARDLQAPGDISDIGVLHRRQVRQCVALPTPLSPGHDLPPVQGGTGLRGGGRGGGAGGRGVCRPGRARCRQAHAAVQAELRPAALQGASLIKALYILLTLAVIQLKCDWGGCN